MSHILVSSGFSFSEYEKIRSESEETEGMGQTESSPLNCCGQQLELIGPLRLHGPPISALTDDFVTFESENVEKFHLKPNVWRQPKRYMRTENEGFRAQT